MEKIERIIPVSDLRSKAKKYVDFVRLTEEPVIITQRGYAAAMLVNYETYYGRQITLNEKSYPDWKKRLARAERETREGKGIELNAYLKKRVRSKAARNRKAA